MRVVLGSCVCPTAPPLATLVKKPLYLPHVLQDVGVPEACQDDRVQAASGAAAAAATAAPQDGPVAPAPGDLVPEPKSQVGHMLSTACKAQSGRRHALATAHGGCLQAISSLQFSNCSTCVCALAAYACAAGGCSGWQPCCWSD
jgi:hypothetical protein